jgi:hypothetical protein
MAEGRRRLGAERARSTSSRPWWKRRFVWVGGVLAAVLTATVVNVLTGQAQKIIDSATAPRYDGPPVKVALVSLERSDYGSYVFPNRLELRTEELRSLNEAGHDYSDPARYDTWFRSRGGVEAGLSNVKVVLEGNRDHPVRIIGMRPIKHCQAPLLGSIFYSPPAGAEPSITIGFDLDSTRSIARTVTDDGQWRGDYFANYTVGLKPGEQQTLQIAFKAHRHYCEYTLALTIVDEDRTVTQVVDNNRKPFRITGWPLDRRSDVEFRRYQAMYIGGAASPKDGFIRVDPLTYRD